MHSGVTTVTIPCNVQLKRKKKKKIKRIKGMKLYEIGRAIQKKKWNCIKCKIIITCSLLF